MASGNLLGIDNASFGGISPEATATSAARSDAVQGGVSVGLGSPFNVYGGGVFNTVTSSQASWARPLPTDITPNPRVEGGFFNDPFNIALIALGGLGIWLLLKK